MQKTWTTVARKCLGVFLGAILVVGLVELWGIPYPYRTFVLLIGGSLFGCFVLPLM